MVRQRLSNARHRLNGTFRADRHGSSPEPSAAIDPAPPAGMTDAAERAWHELVKAGAEWLAQSDRAAVEVAAGLLAKSRAGELSAAALAQLSAMLHRLGMTPAGRRSVDKLPSAPKDANEFNQF